jgi:predicted glycoside hydrolase/deacetylase ChbG (UPF0249 family)
MNKLIVNADDFGYSYSVNKGIIEAHQKGVVTATSVMVDAIAAEEAANLHKFPDLSVGLHFAVTDFNDVMPELKRQFQKFVTITGYEPDHINSHKIYTENPGLMNYLLVFGREHDIPVRRLGSVKFIDSFFGPHAGSDVSVAQLKKTIDEATEEHNEIMCHVGYSDDYLRKTSSYNDMREQELATICDPSIKQYLEEKSLELINWKQINPQTYYL